MQALRSNCASSHYQKRVKFRTLISYSSGISIRCHSPFQVSFIMKIWPLNCPLKLPLPVCRPIARHIPSEDIGGQSSSVITSLAINICLIMKTVSILKGRIPAGTAQIGPNNEECQLFSARIHAGNEEFFREPGRAVPAQGRRATSAWKA